jgi:hypothetical protein
VRGSINKVWNWGIEEGLVFEGAKSPLHGLVIESKKNKYKQILTLPEIRKLLYQAELCEHPWRHVWAIALLTGIGVRHSHSHSFYHKFFVVLGRY